MENPDFLDQKQAMQYLRVAKITLYRLTAENEIPYYKPKGKIYFLKADLDTYLRTRRIMSKYEKKIV